MLCFSFVVVLYSMYSLHAIIKVVLLLLLNERGCHLYVTTTWGLKVHSQGQQTIRVYWGIIILTLPNFWEGGGRGAVTVILNLIFRRVGDKNFKFCFENQVLIGRVAHEKSSDPATLQKFGTYTCCRCITLIIVLSFWSLSTSPVLSGTPRTTKDILKMKATKSKQLNMSNT